MDEHAVVTTRRSLHAVAERLLAGPQYREHGEIRLRVTPGGFGQFDGPLRVEGVEVVGERGRVADARHDRRHRGRLWASRPANPLDLYAEHADFGPDEELAVDPVAATLLLDGSRAATRRCGSSHPRRTRCSPEHFDLGIATDEVNYGVSPATPAHPLPDAYVGPGRLARESSGTRRSAPSGLRRNCPTPTQ